VVASAQSRLVDVHVQSTSFAHNKIGIASTRNATVYLPDGYDASARRYPVVYFLHNLFEDHRTLYASYDAKALFDTAIRNKVVPEVIVVSGDFSTPFGGSIYTNSPVTGNWEDFLVDELVAYVDASYRTLAHRDSRGLAGDRMGGYGAIRIGMRHPDVFGSVYALHPVGTGTGLQTMYSRPNWELLANAKTLDEVKADFFSSLFLAIFQAHVPNTDRPPLFIDFPARKVGGEIVVDTAVTERLHASFALERMVPRYAENLKSLRGFKFDWGRGDTNQDHIYSNQAFTHKLNEFGIPHEADEYNGGWGDKHWGVRGRVYTELLPFFREHLAIEAGH
jgi:enterochelin esterase-like enzyme